MTDPRDDEPIGEQPEAEGAADDGRPGTPEGNAAADRAMAEEGMIAPDGPDVETSLSPEDQAFLDGLGAEQPVATEAEPEDDTLLQLRRVNAEYANYRKRVERDRDVERERAVGDAIRAILPVLDDLDRAEKHGDLADGPMTAIAQKLRTQVGKLGVTPFGEAGEPFDPTQHEAIFQKPNPEVERETVFDVVERGYRVGDTILRAAKVVVDTPNGS